MFKQKELGKCWGCQGPWTLEHKFTCKFRKAVNTMAFNLDDWLVVEQQMEEENHVLLQTKTEDSKAE
jgi:hypothetical protein